MSVHLDSRVAAWQSKAGLVLPSRDQIAAYDAISETAFKLIKAIELEKSGIRDGNSAWHGSDPLLAYGMDLVRGLLKAKCIFAFDIEGVLLDANAAETG
ncbi:hypothetical protein C5L14_16645 [Labrys okinawensis]|uniref:Uncharacterized protein n=1 Tax=Labrys okinawensis TaxID=346911 RepID=A0A2S9QC41_9HYPH|nr:hypothetical protein [Labrys okinawensis]PRH86914.1 hypothetical protein C5L14_16645 [Labrys okinawensis]